MQGESHVGEPCKVCGCTDLNLIDGFYYCVECGTQDVNVRETVIEEYQPDGTYNFKGARTTKIKKTVQEGDTVSPEWHKWHAYNYILAGLVDEVMSFGAEPSFKSKVLWLWTMYVKKFQSRKELGLAVEDDADLSEYVPIYKKRKMTGKYIRKAYKLEQMSNTLFFTILYLALNFDKSDIQLTHLIRFAQERRLSYRDCTKFVPKDIDVYLVDKFYTLRISSDLTHRYVRVYAKSFIETFNLRPPVLPDLKKIADRFITELCLPDDFKSLVYSLMQLVPCEYLNLDEDVMKKIETIPFYECVVMSYVVVGLKMCFGLDDNYEIQLSDAVDQINTENCHMKCYKLGVFTTLSSDRLFSFRQWCCFLKLRKVVLCKFYWPIAQISNMDVDDYVYMEQRQPPPVYKAKRSTATILADEITMKILNKIDENLKVDVVPKSAFPPTLTPLTTYTDVILEYYKDPELRLLLSEDFTKYSLKYACEILDLRVSDNADNIVVGVDESGKYVEPIINGNLKYNEHDWSMTYVRNCENKNWLHTNPPTLHHIEKVDDNDKINDGYVSSENNSLAENNSLEITAEISKADDSSVKNDVDIEDKTDILQEDSSVNIFDDDFHNLKEYEENKHNVNIKTEPIDEDISETNDIDNHGVDNDDSLSRVRNLDQDNDNNLSDTGDNIAYFFNPENFDKEETIRELVLLTCKKYSIPIPPEFKIKEQKKIINTRETQTSEPKPKKAKLSRAEMQARIYDLLSAYNENVRHDEFANIITNNALEVRDTRNYTGITEHNAYDENDENLNNNTVFDTHDESIDDTDNSVLLVEDKAVQFHHEDDPDLNTQADLFDENVYDIKQLYLKVQETCNEDVFDISNDPEVDKLLAKKIDECNTVKTKNIAATKKLEEINDDDSDNDIPLSVIKAEKHRWLRNQKNWKEYNKLNYLIKNRKDIEKFNYWTRHPTNIIRHMQCSRMASRFSMDLKENYPKSFGFVLEECAAILDCTTISLYQYVVLLEQKLLSK